MLARNKLLLAVLLSAVLVSAAAYAAKAPVNPEEPVTMTKGMYADLLCVAASEFDCYHGGVQFTYDPASDTVKAVYLSPTRSDKLSNPAAAEANWKSQAKERADRRLQSILPKIQKNVSPAASTAFVGF